MNSHTPVLLSTVLDILRIQSGDAILDATVGLGGHSEAFIQAAGINGSLIALDADAKNLTSSKERLNKYADRIIYIHANFSELPDCLPADQRIFDIIFADLGVSSPHFDDPSRGFTFRTDSQLDMRYDQSQGMTAGEILHHATAETLLSIFQKFGELRGTKRLVDSIIKHRSTAPITISSQLKTISEEVYGYRSPKVLPQIFQALRIAVNKELESLEYLLATAPTLLNPGGRLAILTYHSLEDRLVKHAFRSLTTPEKDPQTGAVSRQAPFVSLTRHAIGPTGQEIENNPRARSAMLRAIQRISLPSF